jgi:hypothetical protein
MHAAMGARGHESQACGTFRRHVRERACAVVPLDELQTGRAAQELSGSGMDERRCSAQGRRADPGM